MNGATILVVDDSDQALETITTTLSPLSARLVVAHDGDEALRAVNDCDDLALIILDVTTPESHGFEVAERLRQRPRFAPVPIIFMSAAIASDEVFEGYDLGAVDYIVKPVSPQVLQAKVGVFAELRRQRRQLANANHALERAVAQRIAELRWSERRFRSVFESSVGGIAIVGPDGRLIQANAAFARLVGYAPDALVGVPLSKLAYPDEREPQITPANNIAAAEHRFVDSSGDVVWGELSVAWIFDDAGEPQHAVALIQDVTNRKRAEEDKAALAARLHEIQKLEAIGTLASGVAHDFNNLLMGISGCADIAAGQIADDSPARALLQAIKASADSGAAISSQLLTFSRTSHSRPEVLELNTVVRRTKDVLERLLGADVEIELRLDAEDSRVCAEAGQLDQIIVNLAINARDAMPNGGRLTIETDNCRRAEADVFYAGTPCNCVCLRVCDTGDGMADEVKQRVFEPFYTTKGLGKGTGLGLSIVHGIVRQAGGRIEVRSEIGHGTTFDIALPLSTDATAHSPADAADEADVGGATVLLVEDESLVREAVRYYLEAGGYRVIAAANGADAIDAMRDVADIDVLVTDVVMPGMGGMELARWTHDRHPSAAVLYMSGHSAQWLVEQGRIEASADVLQKPCSAEAIRARVALAVSMARHRRLAD